MAVQPNEQFSLDPSQKKAFEKYFNSLPQKSPTTVRIFDRTDYYTAHGEDAIFTAKEVFKTASVVKYYGKDVGEKDRLPYVTLNRSNFEWWIRELLLVRQYRIEIFGNEGTSKNSNWVLKHKASPGNLAEFEDLLFGAASSSESSGIASGLLAISLGKRNGQKVVGIAYVDRASPVFNVCEFTDDDHYSNIEAVLVQLSPSECLISTGETNSQIKQILDKSSILTTERKKNEFQTSDITQDLNRLLKLSKGLETCLHLPEIEYKIAMSALAAIIKFLELLSDDNNLGRYHLKSFDMSQFAKLDGNAVDALQLAPSPYDSNVVHSLYGVLNKCRTGQGQRLLLKWIKQPLLDINKIVERQNIVEAFVEDGELRRRLYEDMLRKIPDFQKLMMRFVRLKATLQDSYRVYQALQRLPHLVDALSNYSGNAAHLLQANFCIPIQDLLTDFEKFQELVEQTMDLSLVDNNEYVIKADFDESLGELREKMNNLEAEIKSMVDKVAKNVGGSVKLDSNAQLGYFFRVTLKEEKSLRGNPKYKIIDATKTGVRFQNADLKHLNEEYMTTKQEYEEQQKAVVTEVLKVAAGYAEPMQLLGEILSSLDVFVGLAIAATTPMINYVKPKMLTKGSGIIRLTKARHPCVELQDGICFVPNDVTFDEEKRFLIVTGPNMGGKSTYMRTVAVSVLMAQMGSFVPCETAEISVVDAILTRIGSEDCHARAMSTFMLEMIEMSHILRTATKDSLLIIDELGRGTSTYDGFGLAWAISEKIASKIKSYCMFATHFHELTTLSEELSTVQNLHITATIGADGPAFLYQVEKGVCDRSYGIHVAELVRFPEEVLQCARLKAQEFEDFQSSTLLDYPELTGSDETAVSNRRKAKQEGEIVIKTFLQKLKELDIENMKQEEIDCAVKKLKADVLSHNNAFIKDILNRPIIAD
ncbi:MutS-like protein [Chamberlinius hualienensis]